MTEGTRTLADLLERTLPQIKWTVEGLVPEGLTILAGKPKLGKSRLVFLMALMVAAGERFLGFKTLPGEVLYIALEDGERRLQDLAGWHGARSLTNLDRFHYQTTWSSLDHGGLEAIEQWIADHPQARLIVVDTWALIRGRLAGKDRYQEEYNALAPLQSCRSGVASRWSWSTISERRAPTTGSKHSRDRRQSVEQPTLCSVSSANAARWMPLSSSSVERRKNSSSPSGSTTGAGDRSGVPPTTDTQSSELRCSKLCESWEEKARSLTSRSSPAKRRRTLRSCWPRSSARERFGRERSTASMP